MKTHETYKRIEITNIFTLEYGKEYDFKVQLMEEPTECLDSADTIDLFYHLKNTFDAVEIIFVDIFYREKIKKIEFNTINYKNILRKKIIKLENKTRDCVIKDIDNEQYQLIQKTPIEILGFINSTFGTELETIQIFVTGSIK